MANNLQKLLISFLTAAALLLAGCGDSTAQSTEKISGDAAQTNSIVSIDEEKNPEAGVLPPAPPQSAQSHEKQEPESEPIVPSDTPAEELQTDEQILPPTAESTASSLLACNFYDEMMFEEHLAGKDAAAQILDMQTNLKAAIIPHHLLAGDYIAAIFEQAAKENFETIVFLAPNHTGQGGNIVYSASDWQTPFGVISCDKELTEFLMRDKQIKGNSNDTRMQEDHAISGLIPYMAYFMPEVQTVSVLLSGSVEFAKVRYLTELLAQSERKILLICSVDFSHYLQANEAAAKDKETIEMIEAGNFPAIADLNNDYFDSAPCVTAFLSYAQRLGIKQKLHWNGSSSEIVGYGPEKYIEGGITTYQIWMLNEE